MDLLMAQAIAYVELQKPQHASLVEVSTARSEELIQKFERVTKNELAVEIAVCDCLDSVGGVF